MPGPQGERRSSREAGYWDHQLPLCNLLYPSDCRNCRNYPMVAREFHRGPAGTIHQIVGGGPAPRHIATRLQQKGTRRTWRT